MSVSLALDHITKHYPGVVALNNLSMSFDQAEIHAIMGENGAGKSTLIKIISGAIAPDSGELQIHGQRFAKMTPALSRRLGIGVIYQELNLVPCLSVAENIFLGEKIGGAFTVDFGAMEVRAASLMRDLGVAINPKQMVRELTIAQQQIVEIAKALAKDARFIIMDEPTASLALAEVEHLIKIVSRLKEKGVTVIYISHRMDEVFRLADRITILRDGTYIDTIDARTSTRRQVVAMMVGRELNESYPERSQYPGEPVLEVRSLCGNGDRDISFTLHQGEIFGVAGLVGSGRTELAKMLCGDVQPDTGDIRLHGRPVHVRSPKQAVQLGIGLIPENRKSEGAFLEYSVRWNIDVMSLRQHSKFTVVNSTHLATQAKDYVERLRIKTPSMDQLVRNLSGGNQQKVVLAKVLAAQTNIIILDEPTRGIDVGAKQEIYELMNQLTAQGISIIMVSSEMEELIGMSDRILVMHEGTQAAILNKSEFDQTRILELASGM